MMPSYFEQKLWELLPPLYCTLDQSGDLAAFLEVPAATLDELKDLIDRFPRIFDVDRCEERFLPYLAALVGVPFDATADPMALRRLIKEAVPIYQRKGTIPGIRRALEEIGWQGQIEETFRRALRLGSRSVLNESKLPGQLYSLGVYRVITEIASGDPRGKLAFHHPAGTRAFFWQRLIDWTSYEDELSAMEKLLVQRLLLAELDEAFSLNHTPLGACFHLTRKQKAFGVLALTNGSTLTTDFRDAAVCLATWHGRGDRMRLGRKALNTRMLANCWESERKSAICCEIQARRQPAIRATPMQLNVADLNGALLGHANVPCRSRFRQKDYYGETTRLDPGCEGEGVAVTRFSDSRLARWFRTNRSRVSSEDHLNGRFRAAMFVAAIKVDAYYAGVTEAWDVVERWRRRGPAFTLGAHALNGRSLTDANLTEERASFEMRIETGDSRSGHTQTLRLNQRELNQVALRLSVTRARPLRLGRMALNQAGPRLARPNIIWRFRQKDFHLAGMPAMSMSATLGTLN